MLCCQIRKSCEYVATLTSVTIRETLKDSRSLDVLLRDPDGREIHVLAPVGSSWFNPLIENLLTVCGSEITEAAFDHLLEGEMDGTRLKVIHTATSDSNRMPWSLVHFAAIAA